MRDALGGSVSLVIIVVFIVIALGYMAFNVNYTKAFRMKDKIITTYEDYNGNCGSDCKKVIKDYAKTLGYATGNDLHCPNGYSQVDKLYCYKVVDVVDNSSSGSFSDIKSGANNYSSDTKPKVYYSIVTKINLQIPIISNVFDFRFFYIYGDTKSFEVD